MRSEVDASQVELDRVPARRDLHGTREEQVRVLAWSLEPGFEAALPLLSQHPAGERAVSVPDRLVLAVLRAGRWVFDLHRLVQVRGDDEDVVLSHGRLP